MPGVAMPGVAMTVGALPVGATPVGATPVGTLPETPSSEAAPVGALPVSRLRKRAEFLRARAEGRKAATPGLVLQAARREPGAGARVGFTVTKKVGNAVMRNRARRRLREAARLAFAAEPPVDVDLVLIGRDGTLTRPFAALRRDLADAMRRTGARRAGTSEPG